ncbi:Conserved oligomeric Golgi complex subunit 6 [Lamellibrachia satsuma]|nr:Conserved oligomeric Golgi complex subunit 6 [Lamellibrachia satsuma]
MADKEQSTDSLTAASQPNNPLSRKLNKLLDTRLDNDKDMLEALKSLSTFFTGNNLRSRRSLRSDIERKSLAINEEFVQSFAEVNKQLESIYTDVRGMSECCQDMTSRLKSSKEQTRDLISQTTKLQAESQKLHMKSQVVDAFLAKFQLKPHEVKVLRGTKDGSLHPDFFTALTRVKQIHNDCKVLLRTNQQTAGLEIMESMALHQESAYERLYRWAQNECRLLSSESPDVSNQLCDAMLSLKDRPVLFRYTLDEFGTARRTAIVRGFIDALTKGGPGGTPRPIELHSHDPLRYVGDMLAWLHQAIASEREYIQALLKKCPMEEIDKQTVDILGHITEGVCRALKVRVEQVLVSVPGSVELYKLANLLQFYCSTIGEIMKTDSGALLSTLSELHTLGVKMFYNSLHCHASKQMEKVEFPPPDLGPTSALNKTLRLLQDILSSHDNSVVPLDTRREHFSQILSCMMDPLIQMCSVSASHLSTVDMATYMVNCIYLIQSTLALYEFTDQRLEMLQAQVDAHIDTLVSEQASFVLNQSGLAYLFGTVQQHQPKQGPLSALQGMDSVTVKAAMTKFDSYLASPDVYVMQQCALLLSTKLREAVKKRAVSLLCQAYQQMYSAILAAENKYPNPNTLVPRTPDQVSKLLS